MSASLPLAARLQQDAQFFDNMLHLVPSFYSNPPEQDTNNKFTHSKSAAVNARQSMKENSKQGLKAKAKFDLKNYTSVLSNGKSAAATSADDDDDEEMDDDEEDEDDDEDDEDADNSDAMSDLDDAPKSKKSAAAAGKKPNGAAASTAPVSAVRPPVVKPAAAPSSTSVLLAGAPLSSLLPVPSLSSISADVGMDQLRQRLHERINGLSNKRKPEDHPFAKKRMKKEKDLKKREKNDKKPSSHKNTKNTYQRDTDEDQPPSKRQKSSSLAHPSSNPSFQASNSPTLKPSQPTSSTGLRATDLLDSNDFQFAALKQTDNTSGASEKSGSYSLQGKQQRKKKVSDETLLKDVESFKDRVAELKASGKVEQASKLEHEKSMDTALLRAQGIKVKDDARLLKKSLKREEKKKEKSRSEWGERLATQKSTQDAHHAAKIASASKKGKGDRSRAGGTAEDEAAASASSGSKEKTGRSSGADKANSQKKPSGGRAGFEGKGKKFLN